MKHLLFATTALYVAALMSASAFAADTNPNGNSAATPITIAVFGDWPYYQCCSIARHC